MSLLNLAPDLFPTETENKLTICQKLKFLLKNITVEPIVFFSILGGLMCMMSNQNLALEKSCRVNLHFNRSICDAITERNQSGYDKSQEAEVQALVQQYEAYRSFFQGSIPVVLVIFLGTWSDRHNRRKPLVMFPLIGGIISSSLLLLCSIYFMELKMQFSWLSDFVPNTLTGGYVVLLLGIYSYVGSMGDDESKTVRIGTITMAQTIATSVGMLLSGIVLHSVGFIGVYAIVCSIMVGCLLYCIFVMKEQEITSPEIEPTKESFREMFALKHIKSMFETCFGKGEGNRRQKMIFIMILITLSIGPSMGEIPITYLSVRLRFGWNEVNYSFYTSFQFVIQLIGNFITLAGLTKYLKLRDVTLGIIAMCSKMTASVIYAFAPTGFVFYFGAAAEILGGANLVALRAMMAKIVKPHELGQSNSVFGICEGLTPILFGPLYSFIYIKTLLVFPGAIYLVTGSISAIVIVLYFWMFNIAKNEEKMQPEDPLRTEVEEGLLQRNLPTELKRSLEIIKA